MPYNAQTYEDWLNPAQPTYQARGPRMIGGQGGMTQYQYTGDSTSGYIRQNLTNDFTKPSASNAMLFASGGASQIPRAILGRQAFKRAQKMDRADRQLWENSARTAAAKAPTEYLNAVDPTSRAAQYARERGSAGQPYATNEELQAVSDLEERDKLRGAATSKINAYFGDPARAAEYERLTQDQLRADTQNIGTNFDTADTKMKLNAARQGLTGGSVEAENSTSLGGQRSASLIDAAQGANKTFSNLTARDRSVQDQLLTLVNSDDPYTRQAAQAQLQGMSQQTANDAYQEVANQTRRDANQFNQNQMSQSIGGGLTGLSNLIQQDPNRSSLSAWYTPARS